VISLSQCVFSVFFTHHTCTFVKIFHRQTSLFYHGDAFQCVVVLRYGNLGENRIGCVFVYPERNYGVCLSVGLCLRVSLCLCVCVCKCERVHKSLFSGKFWYLIFANQFEFWKSKILFARTHFPSKSFLDFFKHYQFSHVHENMKWSILKQFDAHSSPNTTHPFLRIGSYSLFPQAYTSPD